MTKEKSTRSLTEDRNSAALRQLQSTTPRKADAASPARHTAGKTPTNPLQGLFSDDELAMIDQRCKAMGRNVVEIVVSALRNWVKADGQEDDSHLENDTPPKTDDQEAQRAAEFARFAVPFGKEIARVVGEHGCWEAIYEAGLFYFFIFEFKEVFENGEWLVLDEYMLENEGGLASLGSKPVRRALSFCPYEPEEVAAFFDRFGLPHPENFARRLDSHLEHHRQREEQIARKAVAHERARIARVMNQALAA